MNNTKSSFYSPAGGSGVLTDSEYVFTGNGNSEVRHSVLCGPIPHILVNHVLLVMANVKFEEYLPDWANYGGIKFSGIPSIELYKKPASTLGVYEKCYQCVRVSQASSAYVRIGYGTTNFNVNIKNLVMFDLTLMFGAGNEPSTIEEFERLFPEPYYAYGHLIAPPISFLLTDIY